MPGYPEPESEQQPTSKPIGIIIPPPEIKSFLNNIEIADKTAEYVAKNGSTFEDLVLKTEYSNPKFCFLKHEDPYRAYYDFKITEFAKGLGIFIDFQIQVKIVRERKKNHMKPLKI